MANVYLSFENVAFLMLISAHYSKNTGQTYNFKSTFYDQSNKGLGF